MDLSSITYKEAVKVPVTHPATGAPILDDKGKAMFVEVVSADSPEYRRAVADAMKIEGDRDGQISALLARCCKKWHLQVEKKSPKDVDALTEVLKRPEMVFLRNLIDKSVHTRANFFGDASAN